MRKVFILSLTMCVLLTIYRLSRPGLPTLFVGGSPVVALGSTPEPTPIPTRSAQQGFIASPTVAAFFRTENTLRPSGSAASLTAAKAATLSSTVADLNPGARRLSNTRESALSASQMTDTQPFSRSLRYDTAAYHEVSIYDEALDQNWSFAESRGVQYMPTDTSNWRETLPAGSSLIRGITALAVTPEQEDGMFVFSVRTDTTVQYRLDEVLGVSFWLTGGDMLIEPDDLFVTVMGNDTQPFWTEREAAAMADGDTIFSETKLYYLRINRSIPPNTWVNIIVWPDKLIYDPTYTYVTGFYIKNDLEVNFTYYIDHVSLLMLNTP